MTVKISKLLFSQCENNKLLWRHIIVIIWVCYAKIVVRVLTNSARPEGECTMCQNPGQTTVKILSHSWNKFHIQCQTIEYPLYIMHVTIQHYKWLKFRLGNSFKVFFSTLYSVVFMSVSWVLYLFAFIVSIHNIY